MANQTASPATAHQVAMFGDVTAAIRKAMDAKGWKPGDLNEQLGKHRSYSAAYQWWNCKGAPGNTIRTKVAKALGIPAKDLIPRKIPASFKERKEIVVVTPTAVRPSPTKIDHVLTFTVDTTGMARLRFDVALPVKVAMPLFRMIMDQAELQNVLLDAPPDA